MELAFDIADAQPLPNLGEDLPDDLLLAILRRGNSKTHTNARQVSKRFAKAVEAACCLRNCADLRFYLRGVEDVLLAGSLSRLHNLHQLRLRGTDIARPALGRALQGAVLPQLRYLDLRAQRFVDGGLLLELPTSLRAVDLTFCGAVDYASVVRMRRRLPELRLVRRVPASFCGTLLQSSGERQTIWADGAFASNRRAPEARGWIAALREGSSSGGGGAAIPDVRTHSSERRHLECRLVFSDCPLDDPMEPQAHNGRMGFLMRVIRPGGGCDLSEAEEEELALDLAMRDDLSSRSAAATGVACPAPPHLRQRPRSHQRPLPREALVVQSTRLPEPPAVFPQLPDEALPQTLGSAIRTSRLNIGMPGLRVARLMLNPLPLGAQEAPTAVAASLAAFCEREPLASSEFERRARRSIVDQCRGVQRLAAAVGALLPRHAFEPVHWQTIGDAARAAWDHRTGDTGHQHHGGEEALPPLADEDDDISSSSEDEESDFEDVELA